MYKYNNTHSLWEHIPVTISELCEIYILRYNLILKKINHKLSIFYNKCYIPRFFQRNNLNYSVFFKISDFTKTTELGYAEYSTKAKSETLGTIFLNADIIKNLLIYGTRYIFIIELNYFEYDDVGKQIKINYEDKSPFILER